MKKLCVKLSFVFLLILSGCATQQKTPDIHVKQAMMPAYVLNIEHRKALATQLFKEQDFYAALTQWRILKAIDPENEEYINRISVLEALIKRRIKGYLVKGKEALLKDKLHQAEVQLLKALALDPNDYFALKMMREIEARRVKKVQVVKTNKLMKKQLAKYQAEQDRKKRKLNVSQLSDQDDEDEDMQSDEAGTQEAFYLDMGKVLFKKGDWGGAIREIDKYLSSNKSTPSIQAMLKTAHTNMGYMFEKRGHWEPAIQHIESALENADDAKSIRALEFQHNNLKKKASEYYYVEGVKVYRDNVDRAIIFWEQAISLNPQHEKALERVAKARQLKQNLNKIKQ